MNKTRSIGKKESIFVNVVSDGGVEVMVEMGKDHLMSRAVGFMKLQRA